MLGCSSICSSHSKHVLGGIAATPCKDHEEGRVIARDVKIGEPGNALLEKQIHSVRNHKVEAQESAVYHLAVRTLKSSLVLLLRRLQMCWRGHCPEGAAHVCCCQSSLQCKEHCTQELVVIRSCSCRQEWCVHPAVDRIYWAWWLKLFHLALTCSTDVCTPLLHSSLCLAASAGYRIWQRSLRGYLRILLRM